MTTTPYMVLELPDVSVTIGPDWADDLNTALERVDAHDHSTGNGVQVTPAGMLINDDLPFDSNNVTELRSARFASQSGTLGTVDDKGCVYEVNGDLYYNNSAGTAVQITSGSAIVTPGGASITSKFPGAYPYTVLTTDAQKILLVSTPTARVINLPAATTNMYFEIKDISGTAQTNNITIVKNGTDTVEGGASYVCNTNYGAWALVSDGISAWYVV